MNVYRQVSVDSVDHITEAARQTNLWSMSEQCIARKSARNSRTPWLLRGTILSCLSEVEEDYQSEFEVGF
jgi:hypothetical protein